MLFSVVLHRGRQAVTGTKKIDADVDTIQTICEQNNKRYAFHNTLNYLSNRLITESKKAIQSPDDSPCNNNNSDFIKRNAVRFNAANASKRFAVDHSVLGKLGETGATPFGRGKSKAAVEQHQNYADYKDRINTCVGVPARIYDQKKRTTPQLSHQALIIVTYAKHEE